MSVPVENSVSIEPIPAFQDNYLWLIRKGRQAAIVDPGDAAPVEATLARLGLDLSAIVLTHHHPDHVGGVGALLAHRSIPVFGPAGEIIEGVTQLLREGDRIVVPGVDLALEVFDVPGHTLGHIAYFGMAGTQPVLFCGDTLFAGGCGRLFEGTPTQMHASLAKLAALPGNTRIYCAHEYTQSNLRFALAVEPDNAALQARVRHVAELRAAGQPTVPSTIAEERATNPFLRSDAADVRAAAAAHSPDASADPVATFAAIRAWKDHF